MVAPEWEIPCCYTGWERCIEDFESTGTKKFNTVGRTPREFNKERFQITEAEQECHKDLFKDQSYSERLEIMLVLSAKSIIRIDGGKISENV